MLERLRPAGAESTMATLLRRTERATWTLQGTLPWQVPHVPGFSETWFCIMTNHRQGESPRQRENTMSAYKLSLRQRSGESRGEGAATRRCVAGAGSEPGALAWLLRRGLGRFTLAAALVVLAVMPAQADGADGDLRLRGGPSHNEGRLEIFHDDEWGTVCDDFFGRIDAKVACKQMGYTGAEAVLTDVVVAPGRRFWLDDVNCVGNEDELTECFYNSNVRNSSSRTDPQWGIANCIPAEQVGVRCTASTSANSVELNESALTVQEQGGGSRYTVRLGKAPTGNVTVAISGQSSTVTVDSTPLTFTTGNWSTPQRVTLTAFDDSNRTDDSFTLTHTASGGGYGSVTASLSVTVEDDDGPVQAQIDSGGIVSLNEGESRTYRIWLDSAPTEQVTVAVTAPSKVSVNPASLTFTTGNWSTPQTVTLEASHDNDTSDETQYVTHRATKGDYTTTLSRVQVEITDDDDGEDQIGARPSGALWWAALTARRETGGATGHINYTAPHADLGKLSDSEGGSRFTYDGVTRAIEAMFVDSSGHFQLWVDSGDESALPNSAVLHVGNQSVTLASATRHSFKTIYNDGPAPTMREDTYWWQSGSHGVSLSDRQVVAAWLEAPAGSELPGTPRSVEAQARDGKANLEWVAPPEVPSKPVTSYEYQQEGTEEWTSTGGTATTKEVAGLANGESYTFRVRAVNAAGKGAASAPSNAVTPTVAVTPAASLTASFVSVPAEHDGVTAFWLELSFDAAVAKGSRKHIRALLGVTGGSETRMRRKDDRLDHWRIRIEPSSDEAVTVTLSPSPACGETGAVCTDDGRTFTTALAQTIPGPATPRHLIGTDDDDTLSGQDGNDTLEGGLGDDTLDGGLGDDILYGDDGDPDVTDPAEGDDVLYGEGGDDVLYGDAGDDELYGGADNDELYGDADDDELYGESGDDDLYGGGGDDVLDGGGGADILTGGAGADTFVFAAGHGTDTITDFSPEEVDLIDLRALSGITGFAALTLTAEDTDTLLDLSAHGGGTVRLEDIAVADLAAEDFLLP